MSSPRTTCKTLGKTNLQRCLKCPQRNCAVRLKNLIGESAWLCSLRQPSRSSCSLWFGWGFLSFPEKFQNSGLGPFGSRSVRLGFGVLSLWALYHGYRTYKVLWPSLASSDADLKTTLQSYRQQLEKRRDYIKKIWLKSGLILCFLGIAMVVTPVLVRDIINPLRMLADLGPIFALLILWLAIFIPQRRRRQRKLQQEIDQLRAFESGYQSSISVASKI